MLYAFLYIHSFFKNCVNISFVQAIVHWKPWK